jgi:murein DD-endopeptidase MepM/ murein hydrolase activator NlpD
MLGGWIAAAATAFAANGALIDFPTGNRALLTGKPEEFYMHVERNFEGQITHPWEGGQFGFVRGPVRSGDGVIFITLHEGIDIRPLSRDEAGNPLDDIRAAAAGVVVHSSVQPGASNYGRYVVIEQRLGGATFYTLYAHLASIAVAAGQHVRQGEVIGRMGYSGAGLDRPRAHLHFEIGLMLNRNFQQWYDQFAATSPNLHGIYNGMNLAGTDPAAILTHSAKDPSFNLIRHITSIPPYYKITVPNPPGFSFVRDHPWLVPDGDVANPPAWTISFSQSGVPVRAVAAKSPVAGPQIEWVQSSSVTYAQATRGIIGGPAGQPRLTESGRKFLSLITWPDQGSPTP